mgnify:CR=1 FL=1
MMSRQRQSTVAPLSPADRAKRSCLRSTIWILLMFGLAGGLAAIALWVPASDATVNRMLNAWDNLQLRSFPFDITYYQNLIAGDYATALWVFYLATIGPQPFYVQAVYLIWWFAAFMALTHWANREGSFSASIWAGFAWLALMGVMGWQARSPLFETMLLAEMVAVWHMLMSLAALRDWLRSGTQWGFWLAVVFALLAAHAHPLMVMLMPLMMAAMILANRTTRTGWLWLMVLLLAGGLAWLTTSYAPTRAYYENRLALIDASLADAALPQAQVWLQALLNEQVHRPLFDSWLLMGFLAALIAYTLLSSGKLGRWVLALSVLAGGGLFYLARVNDLAPLPAFAALMLWLPQTLWFSQWRSKLAAPLMMLLVTQLRLGALIPLDPIVDRLLPLVAWSVIIAILVWPLALQGRVLLTHWKGWLRRPITTLAGPAAIGVLFILLAQSILLIGAQALQGHNQYAPIEASADALFDYALANDIPLLYILDQTSVEKRLVLRGLSHQDIEIFRSVPPNNAVRLEAHMDQMAAPPHHYRHQAYPVWIEPFGKPLQAPQPDPYFSPGQWHWQNAMPQMRLAHWKANAEMKRDETILGQPLARFELPAQEGMIEASYQTSINGLQYLGRKDFRVVFWAVCDDWPAIESLEVTMRQYDERIDWRDISPREAASQPQGRRVVLAGAEADWVRVPETIADPITFDLRVQTRASEAEGAAFAITGLYIAAPR